MTVDIDSGSLICFLSTLSLWINLFNCPSKKGGINTFFTTSRLQEQTELELEPEPPVFPASANNGRLRPTSDHWYWAKEDLKSGVADPERFDADPDPTLNIDADPYPIFLS